MRAATKWLVLVVVLIGGGGVAANGQALAATNDGLILIPTALQELDEFRVNTGEKAMLNDGTRNVVYVMRVPSEGSIYLNFHVDVASPTGPFVMHAKEICLLKEDPAKGDAAAGRPAPTRYTPFDWFIDTGLAEVHDDSLTVNGMAVVQFTIEVPRADRDDLTLFVRSQRVGTVREIRARIAEKGESE